MRDLMQATAPRTLREKLRRCVLSAPHSQVIDTRVRLHRTRHAAVLLGEPIEDGEYQRLARGDGAFRAFCWIDAAGVGAVKASRPGHVMRSGALCWLRRLNLQTRRPLHTGSIVV